MTTKTSPIDEAAQKSELVSWSACWHAFMMGAAFSVYHEYGGPLIGAFLLLSVFSFMCCLLSGVDCDEVSAEINLWRFVRLGKFFIVCAFIATIAKMYVPFIVEQSFPFGEPLALAFSFYTPLTLVL